jgi:hypothetical protein
MGFEHAPDASLARRAGASPGGRDHLVGGPLHKLGGWILFGDCRPGRHDREAGTGNSEGDCAGGQTQHASAADER